MTFESLRISKKNIVSCFLCLVFLMLLRLLIAAFWSPAGKVLVGDVYCIFFFTFPCGILGQVLYLIV